MCQIWHLMQTDQWGRAQTILMLHQKDRNCSPHIIRQTINVSSIGRRLDAKLREQMKICVNSMLCLMARPQIHPPNVKTCLDVVNTYLKTANFPDEKQVKFVTAYHLKKQNACEIARFNSVFNSEIGHAASVTGVIAPENRPIPCLSGNCESGLRHILHEILSAFRHLSFFR